MVRYGTRTLVHNLEFVPVDRLDWKPEPGAKSALEIAGEVAGNFWWCLPILRGGEWDTSSGRPRPTSLEEARALLTQAAEEYAAALEAAGHELDRMVNIAGGNALGATRRADPGSGPLAPSRADLLFADSPRRPGAALGGSRHQCILRSGQRRIAGLTAGELEQLMRVVGCNGPSVT